jgi:hypothetical protein
VLQAHTHTCRDFAPDVTAGDQQWWDVGAQMTPRLSLVFSLPLIWAGRGGLRAPLQTAMCLDCRPACRSPYNRKSW